MADIELNFTVTGAETLDEDVKAFLKGTVNPALEKALREVGADMAAALKKHIDTDVYGAYKKPRVYKRRKDDNSLGTPLNDVSDIWGSGGNATAYADGRHVTLDYSPSGTHKVKAWSDQDGNALIGRIEKKNPPYKYESQERTIPERPFWQNFVNEMVDEGRLDEFFTNAMALAGVEVVPEGVTREGKDGTY